MEGRPLEDAELIARAKGGDVRAYEELVRRHQGVAARVAYLASRGADDALDAVQEAFVKAYVALPGFRDGAPFRPWLLRIVANEASNRPSVGGALRERLSLHLAERRDRASGCGPIAEGSVLAASERRALLDAIGRLREEDRMVLACRFFLELTEAETAAVLGWPLGTVKSRGSRALRRLRSMMSVDGGDGPIVRAGDGTDG